jgi:hypothetical protein
LLYLTTTNFMSLLFSCSSNIFCFFNLFC